MSFDTSNAGSYFKDKKITVLRIGLLGRGIGDTAYVAEAGAQVTAVDAAPKEVMQSAVDQLSQYQNINWKFGPYDFADFKGADMVLVGAGTPLNEPVLRDCRTAGIRLVQSAALFAELSRVPIIGVTGTRGKSTVTHMIHHVLSQLTGEEVLLGGNVRGVSNLQLLKRVREDSLCVMELDSWQLQGFGWAGISPQVAVFTNFMEDHLNYYEAGGHSREEAMELYFADKANIFRNQEESATFITTPLVFARAQTFAQKAGITIGQEVVLADTSVLPEDMLLSTPGEHNRLNAALAYEALKALNLEDEEIFEALTTFPGVPGRLEYVGATESGVRIYNDNNATTPAATIVGIEAVAAGKNVVLIAGGSYKEVDPSPLLAAFEAHVKRLVLVPGTGTEKLGALLTEGNSSFDCTNVATLKEAVETALAAATSGDVILFSPAFASFGLFKNEYERNDLFMDLARAATE
ncbi:UDP-N-acetylmuramoyl-L-alanine--D-glutamate ligase [Patescibacteria group bacterium]|nr:UDP-N-acetylmuramoyl-L-alanine--D-glutamate ligase [Patescibacteria group bacterium]